MIIENSYNILWLDITSTQKQIIKRWKDILKYVAIWEIPDFDNDLYFVKEYRNEIYIKEAIDNLSNPKNRLINIFFWLDIENEDDKKVFELINNKDFIWAISLLKKSDNEKNIAILYSLVLLDKDISNIELDDTPLELTEKLIIMFYKLSKNEKFWKLFEQKFYLHDDLSTDKKILKEFKSNLGEYLSDLFYDISKNIWDDNVLKIFNKHFSNIKGSKTNNKVDIIYWKLTKIVEKLEWMDISEDWIFDDDEKEELKKSYKEINSLLKQIKNIWLYDDSKTLLIRDNLVKSLRVIMLDLSNNLKEEDESLNILKYCLKIVWTDWLKHKIKEEYSIIKENIEFKPIIKFIKDRKFNKALNLIKKLKEETKDKKSLQTLNEMENQVMNFKNSWKKPLFLFTWWWVWISIYWDTTYFTVLWFPIVPLSSWNVDNLWSWQYIFYWKKEMPIWKKWWKYIILGFLLISFLASLWESNSSSNNYSNSTNYTNTAKNNYDTPTTTFNKVDTITKTSNNKCIFNWKEIEKPLHSSCVKNDRFNAWKCDIWYYEKNNYCWCTSMQYSCNSFVSTVTIDNKIDELEIKINNTYVDRYSQKSIDNYNWLISKSNNLITKRNKILNDNCTCK